MYKEYSWNERCICILKKIGNLLKFVRLKIRIVVLIFFWLILNVVENFFVKLMLMVLRSKMWILL